MLALLQQLLLLTLFALTEAAPTYSIQESYGPQIGGGVVGFIVLVLDIIVWIEVIQSSRPVSHKVLWAVGVFIFPILGVIVYFLFSNRNAHRRGYEAITG